MRISHISPLDGHATGQWRSGGEEKARGPQCPSHLIRRLIDDHGVFPVVLAFSPAPVAATGVKLRIDIPEEAKK